MPQMNLHSKLEQAVLLTQLYFISTVSCLIQKSVGEYFVACQWSFFFPATPLKRWTDYHVRDKGGQTLSSRGVSMAAAITKIPFHGPFLI